MRQLQLEAAASLFFLRIQPAYAQRGAHNPLDCKYSYKKLSYELLTRIYIYLPHIFP